MTQAESLTVIPDRHLEDFAMVRAFFVNDFIGRRASATRLQELEQDTLLVDLGLVRQYFLSPAENQSLNQHAHGSQRAVQINRPQDRLKTVSQN